VVSFAPARATPNALLQALSELVVAIMYPSRTREESKSRQPTVRSPGAANLNEKAPSAAHFQSRLPDPTGDALLTWHLRGNWPQLTEAVAADPGVF
jgi:hypothetical protein